MIRKIVSAVVKLRKSLIYLESNLSRIEPAIVSMHEEVASITKDLSTLSANVDGLREVIQTISTSIIESAAMQSSLTLPPPLLAPETRPVFEYPYNPKVRDWNDTRGIRRLRQILAAPTEEYTLLLDRMVSFLPYFEAIPVREPNDGLSPYWVNGWFPALDSISLYSLLALRNPRTYVEVGSGNSTKFARQAVKDLGLRTKIVSIDPHPRAEIDQICDRVIRQPCEDVDSTFFEELSTEDILFIDNSHRSFQNSDVTVFFMEILPGLQRGTVVGIHDILLPEDYIAGWEDRFYNEQYLLASYLFGGMDGGSILLPNRYVTKEPVLKARLDAVWHSSALAGIEDWGAAFWLVR